MFHIPHIPTPTTTVFTAQQLGTPLCWQPPSALREETEGEQLKSGLCPEECPDRSVLVDGLLPLFSLKISGTGDIQHMLEKFYFLYFVKWRKSLFIDLLK